MRGKRTGRQIRPKREKVDLTEGGKGERTPQETSDRGEALCRARESGGREIRDFEESGGREPKNLFQALPPFFLF